MFIKVTAKNVDTSLDSKNIDPKAVRWNLYKIFPNTSLPDATSGVVSRLTLYTSAAD